MEWNNINENVKDDTNIVETEELFIYNVTIKHGNVDSLMKENSQKKEELLIDKTFMSDLLIIIMEEMLIVLSYDGLYIK